MTEKVIDEHVHDNFRCPAHAHGCECESLETMACNPYWVNRYCPDDLDFAPGTAPASRGTAEVEVENVEELVFPKEE